MDNDLYSDIIERAKEIDSISLRIIRRHEQIESDLYTLNIDLINELKKLLFVRDIGVKTKNYNKKYTIHILVDLYKGNFLNLVITIFGKPRYFYMSWDVAELVDRNGVIIDDMTYYIRNEFDEEKYD